ncbi:hypothetical protein [Carnobacterium iners]|nr:hypothetical protein [Carnobacterium iners]
MSLADTEIIATLKEREASSNIVNANLIIVNMDLVKANEDLDKTNRNLIRKFNCYNLKFKR